MDPVLRNWAGNISFGARRLVTPSRVEDLQETVAAGGRIRALGTGHSFNNLADTTGDLVSVAGLPRLARIDPAAGTLTVSAGSRFGEFTGAVHEAGFALHNLGSLPHISVAGACATGTHGSGTGNGNLATAVRAMEFVRADGELATLERGTPDFAGAVVSLGAIGIVTRLTLDLVPSYDVQQWVYEGLPYQRLRREFDEVLSAAYSVSLFTDWRGERIGQVWLKERLGAEGPRTAPARWRGATLAAGPCHPVPGQPAAFCTEQGGVPGPWQTRLPHFGLDFTPSRGEELQSEYFVDRRDGPDAFDALDRVRERIAPALLVGELRTVAADDLWLSPCHRRDALAFHFTWLPDPEQVLPAVRAVEEALAPYDARPHWGKVFTTGAADLAGSYERWADFRRLLAAYDPEGVFRNDFTERLFPR